MKRLSLQIIALAFILNSTILINNCMSQWIQTNNGILCGAVQSVAIITNNILVGTNNGIYRSVNNGSSYFLTANSTNLDIRAIAFGSSIFAATNMGVLISLDLGASWFGTPFPGINVYGLAASGNNVFAGTPNGIYRSTDNSSTWTQTNLNNQSTYAFAINGSASAAISNSSLVSAPINNIHESSVLIICCFTRLSSFGSSIRWISIASVNSILCSLS